MSRSQALWVRLELKDGRNDALHQGACARHLANHAVQLALVLEDALMPSEPKVSDFMVRDAICAAHWQPISFVRQQMLANSFSYLPFCGRLTTIPDGTLSPMSA